VSIVFTPESRNLVKQDRAAIIEQLHSFLKAKADRAYLFGSFAQNLHEPQSDIDLIVVTATELPYFDRAQAFSEIYGIWPRIDLLVYTPDEFSRQLAQADQGGFWKSVKDTLVQIL